MAYSLPCWAIRTLTWPRHFSYLTGRTFLSKLSSGAHGLNLGHIGKWGFDSLSEKLESSFTRYSIRYHSAYLPFLAITCSIYTGNVRGKTGSTPTRLELWWIRMVSYQDWQDLIDQPATQWPSTRQIFNFKGQYAIVGGQRKNRPSLRYWQTIPNPRRLLATLTLTPHCYVECQHRSL